MRQLIIFITAFFLVCCTENGQHKFSIQNDSLLTIDSVHIGSSVVDLFFDSIPAGETVSKFYSIQRVATSEGIFSAKVYLKDTIVVFHNFGYYSNSNSVSSHVSIILERGLRLRETFIGD